MTVLWWHTLSALATPRRMVPVLLVALPLVASQHAFSHRPWAADAVAVGMLAVFLLTGPFAWRALAPRGAPGLAAYTAIGAAPFLAAVGMTELGELQPSFLVDGLNGAVALGLFVVGGWGLGRDIELEQALQAERARADALRRQADAAGLLALRAHLDPHFLFNTLNAIAEWCTIEPARAEAALLRLASLLRDVLGGVRAEQWPLARELEIARSVLELYAVRDPERYRASFDLEVTDGTVPPLLLLPVVENAVTHGAARGHSGEVVVRTRRVDGRIRIDIESPGPVGPPRPGSTGLPMVRERLALAWGDRARVDLLPTGTGALLRIEIPSPQSSTATPNSVPSP